MFLSIIELTLEGNETLIRNYQTDRSPVKGEFVVMAVDGVQSRYAVTRVDNRLDYNRTDVIVRWLNHE